jgi:hypothetical protein
MVGTITASNLTIIINSIFHGAVCCQSFAILFVAAAKSALSNAQKTCSHNLDKPETVNPCYTRTKLRTAEDHMNGVHTGRGRQSATKGAEKG